MEKVKTKAKEAAAQHNPARKKSGEKDSGTYSVRREDVFRSGSKFRKVGAVQNATITKAVKEAGGHKRGSVVKKTLALAGLKDLDVLIYMDNNTIDTSHLNGIKKLTRNNDAAIARWLHISPRTLTNYSSTKKVLDKKLIEQVVMLRAVLEKGRSVLGTTDAFDNWLDTANFFFDGKKPINFLDTTSGIRYIFDRLIAMEYGDNV